MTVFTSSWKQCATRSMNMTNVIQLTGIESYAIWSATMIAIFRTLKLVEVVVQGLKPSAGMSKEEVDAYNSLNDCALGIFIQVIHGDILKGVVEMETTNDIWLYLISLYHRDTAFALVHQVGSLCQLGWMFDHTRPISEFIINFESEWFKLLKLTRDSSDTYRQQFAVFLGNDKAKRDFLLGLISRHHKNIVDNLTTKDNLTFAEVKQRLLDSDYESCSTALLTMESQNKGRNQKSKKRGRKPEKVPEPDEQCTFCKKHFPDKPRNYSWKTCLQRNSWRNQSNKTDPPKWHEVHMTTNNSQKDSSTSKFVPVL
ncbi:hypothetical protein EV44_g3365 [Erysiphe necator]|uniref:Uncharacterized protein n=1 Tax=Uncinula necator TaxID=52586 RepID=A0A0B1P035_UNCNE|nr:hypothetical protein EV44_g3365 [Erysiphe necator]